MTTTGIKYAFDLEIGNIFGLPVYWYGAVYTIGFLGIFGWIALRRERLGWSMREVLEFSIFMAVGILIGGRIFDILVYESGYYRDVPLQALNWWRGGMASHGVLIGGLLGILLFCRLRRKPAVRTADELSVPAAFLLAVGRIGNFIEGGVIGSVTSLPWGFVYPNVEGSRHPVALYDGAKNLLLVPILMMILKRYPAGRGIATGAFLFLYAALRFVIDLLRDYEGGWFGIGQGQYFNLATALFGLAYLVWAVRRSPAETADPATDPRPAGIVRPLVFIAFCLYPLGIPTSWTQVNIEEKRQDQLQPD